MFAEKLEQDVSPKRNAGKDDRRGGMLSANTVDNECEVARLAGMVEPRGAIRFRAAAAEDQKVGAPASAHGLTEESRDVMRAVRALETVEKDESWRGRSGSCRRIESVHVDEVAVGRVPTLDTSWQGWPRPEEFAPECLRVSALYPPGGSVGILASSAGRHEWLEVERSKSLARDQ